MNPAQVEAIVWCIAVVLTLAFVSISRAIWAIANRPIPNFAPPYVYDHTIEEDDRTMHFHLEAPTFNELVTLVEWVGRGRDDPEPRIR
jgi:hypothetical protein